MKACIIASVLKCSQTIPPNSVGASVAWYPGRGLGVAFAVASCTSHCPSSWAFSVSANQVCEWTSLFSNWSFYRNDRSTLLKDSFVPKYPQSLSFLVSWDASEIPLQAFLLSGTVPLFCSVLLHSPSQAANQLCDLGQVTSSLNLGFLVCEAGSGVLCWQ